MRFNCGEVTEATRLARIKKINDKAREDQRNWFKWFAWFPVWVRKDNDCRWLEYVERKPIYRFWETYPPEFHHFTYRSLDN